MLKINYVINVILRWIIQRMFFGDAKNAIMIFARNFYFILVDVEDVKRQLALLGIISNIQPNILIIIFPVMYVILNH